MHIKKTAFDEKSQPEQPGHQVVGQRVGHACGAVRTPAGTDLPSVYPSARCSPAADCLTVTHRAYGWTWTAVLYCSAASCLPPLRFRERACACLCLCGAPEPIPPPPRASSFLSTAPNHASLRIKLKSTQKSRSPSVFSSLIQAPKAVPAATGKHAGPAARRRRQNRRRGLVSRQISACSFPFREYCLSARSVQITCRDGY